jgi:replicative superfamily II helicase
LEFQQMAGRAGRRGFHKKKEKLQTHRLNTTLSVCKPATCFGCI